MKIYISHEVRWRHEEPRMYHASRFWRIIDADAVPRVGDTLVMPYYEKREGGMEHEGTIERVESVDWWVMKNGKCHIVANTAPYKHDEPWTAEDDAWMLAGGWNKGLAIEAAEIGVV